MRCSVENRLERARRQPAPNGLRGNVEDQDPFRHLLGQRAERFVLWVWQVAVACVLVRKGDEEAVAVALLEALGTNAGTEPHGLNLVDPLGQRGKQVLGTSTWSRARVATRTWLVRIRR